MTLKEYYFDDFGDDINNINFQHGGTPNPGDLFFSENEWVGAVQNNNRKAYFICSMFVTVASDQTMYTYYKDHYNKFKDYTRYPKFGYCGLGPHNQNPLSLIGLPVDNGIIQSSAIENISEEAAKLFVDEIFDFFTQYMNTINPADFLTNFLNDKHIVAFSQSHNWMNNFIKQIRNHLDQKKCNGC
jgi:hypothetical protein